MKKMALLSTLVLIAGCSSASKTPEVEAYPEVAEVSVPCSYSCVENNCPQAMPEPLVLKPRVTEVYSEHKKRRCCPDEEPVAPEQQKTIIPELPEIYVISANRTVNSMLNDAKAVFQDKPVRIFVADTKTADKDLPGGIDKGVKTIKKRLENSSTAILVNSQSRAEYVVNTAVDWFDTPTKQVPAIKYTLTLESKDGVKIGEWTEVVHQADGDRSWW